jgi:hypothetical protein
MTAERRSRILARWLQSHTDEEIVAHAARAELGANGDASISVALTIPPDQVRRLEQLLDGRRYTLSSLARRVFENESVEEVSR